MEWLQGVSEDDEFYCVAFNYTDYKPNVCEPGENIVYNSYFKYPVVEHVKKWDIFETGTEDLEWVVEWENIVNNVIPSLEIHGGVNSWLPYLGDQYVELDGDFDGPGGSSGDNASVNIFQEVATVSGEKYTISFAFSPRPGTDETENVLEVYWEGNLLDIITEDGSGNDNTDWEVHEYVVTATSENSELRFKDGGVSNGKGTFLDAVNVSCNEEDTNGGGNDDFRGELSGKKYRYILEEDEYVKAEEPEIEEWEINLYDDEWTLLDTDYTNESGMYSFGNLDEETYFVCEELLEDWEQVRPEMEYTSDGVIVVENESPNASEEAFYCYQATLSEAYEEIGGLHFGNYEVEYPFGFITNPEEGGIVSGLIDLTAEYYDGDDENDDIVQWAVRQGTCAANTNTVAGNVDGFNDSYDWDGNLFSAPFDAELFDEGEYCFIFNPKDDGDVDVRETVTFFIEHEDTDGGGDDSNDQVTDYCPNIDGDQTEVPVGQHVDSETGDCVDDVVQRGTGGGGSRRSSSSSDDGGEVLGATTEDENSCGMYIFDYMKEGLPNDSLEVEKLQSFLTDQGYVVPVTGFFGTLTDAAVKSFQSFYALDVLKPWGDLGYGDGQTPTGYVYKTTRWKINNIVCPGSEEFPIIP